MSLDLKFRSMVRRLIGTDPNDPNKLGISISYTSRIPGVYDTVTSTNIPETTLTKDVMGSPPIRPDRGRKSEGITFFSDTVVYLMGESWDEQFVDRQPSENDTLEIVIVGGLDGAPYTLPKQYSIVKAIPIISGLRVAAYRLFVNQGVSSSGVQI